MAGTKALSVIKCATNRPPYILQSMIGAHNSQPYIHCFRDILHKTTPFSTVSLSSCRRELNSVIVTLQCSSLFFPAHASLSQPKKTPQMLCCRHASSSSFAESTSSSDSTGEKKSLKRKWLRYLGTPILVLLGSSAAFVLYKIFYYYPQRGLEVFYIPKLPLQIFGPCGRYKGIILFSSMLDSMEKTADFRVRPDDVYVCSFPRSGTTWTQEVVYLLCNEADVSEAKTRIMEERFPYLEDPDSPIDKLNASPSPRLIKTHLPYRLLPTDFHSKKPKLIYITRNPKDVIVSGYHFIGNLKAGYRGSFTEYTNLFFEHKLLFSPWVNHVREYWLHRDDGNILFITYEDMATDLPKEVERIAKFLDKTVTKEEIATIVDHCSFESMKKNDKTNYKWWKQRGYASNKFEFIRKGKVGDWKNHFTPEIETRLKEELERPLAEVGLKLRYEIGKTDSSSK